MKELRYLNIGYKKNILELDIVNYLVTSTKSLFKFEDSMELINVISEKNINLIITKYDLTFFKKIRNIDKKTQILVLTDEIKDQYLVEASNLEYITFLSKELSKNDLKITLKKCIKNLDSNSSNIINLKNDFVFDTYNQALLKDNKIVPLSKKEISYLGFMLNNLNRVASYDEINTNIWNGTMTNDALRSIVKELRKKVYKELIKNISGVGYRIDLI